MTGQGLRLDVGTHEPRALPGQAQRRADQVVPDRVDRRGDLGPGVAEAERRLEPAVQGDVHVAVEGGDVRGMLNHPFEQVARYGGETRLCPVEGHVPDALNFPSGCKFHPRCTFALERCSNEAPPEIVTLLKVLLPSTVTPWEEPRSKVVVPLASETVPPLTSNSAPVPIVKVPSTGPPPAILMVPLGASSL